MDSSSHENDSSGPGREPVRVHEPVLLKDVAEIRIGPETLVTRANTWAAAGDPSIAVEAG